MGMGMGLLKLEIAGMEGRIMVEDRSFNDWLKKACA
jgi:hypothetical protein